MSVRSGRSRARLRAFVECPACGRELECAGLAAPGDLVTVHLRYSCRGARPPDGGRP